MKTIHRLDRSTTIGGVGVATVLLVLFELLIPAAARAADVAAGPLSDVERKAMLAEVTLLQERLAALSKDAKTPADCAADAGVFLKGVAWAVEFGPISDVAGRELLINGLMRARERIEMLVARRSPWAKRRGRVARGFVSGVDGSTQPYSLIVPAGYDPAKPMRLDVVLHGSSGDRAKGVAELNFLRGFDSPDDEAGADAPDVNYIELHPLGRLGENAYRFEGETDVEEAIDAVCRNYNIDRSRIVLRGGSLGGVGAWQIGLKRPDRFVAVGPTAGPVDTYVFAASKRSNFIPLGPLTSWQKLMLHEVDAVDYAANASMVPVVALMGEKDEYFPSHVLMQKAFEKEGVPFVGLIDPGAGHGVTPKASAEQLRMLSTIADKGKDPAPNHVRFVTWTLKFSRCYWVEVMALGKHYERAEIDATLGDDGSVVMAEPKNITCIAFTAPALQSSAATLTIGGAKVDLPPTKDSNSRTRIVQRTSGGTWRCPGTRGEVALEGKRPGLQGPIDDAFGTKFLCVRGTGKPWNPAVAAWADANLKRFADEWKRHYRGELPVKNDVDVTPADLRQCNLILFGDPGSNRWIADVLPKLPARWTRDEVAIGTSPARAANDHTLELIYPNPLDDTGAHYVVLNSGHTYHDYELQLSYMVFPRLGDWAVIKTGENPPTAPAGTVGETVLESGFFDEMWASPFVP